MRFTLPSKWKWQALPPLHPVTLCILVSTALIVFYNDGLWHFIFSAWDEQGTGDYLFLVSIGLTLAAAFTLVSLLFSSSHIIKPTLISLLTLSAAVSYFSINYGIAFDKTMILNIAQTDMGEAGDFVSPGLAAHLLLFAALPGSLIIAIPLKTLSWRKEAYIRVVTVMGCLLLISGSAVSFYQEYASFVRNNRQVRYAINPTSPLYYAFRAASATTQTLSNEFHQVASSVNHTPSAAGDLPMVFVLVLGETARADRFSVNGYDRKTNPSLLTLPVISFANVTSCGTSTAVSVPCLFSSQSQSDFSVDEDQSSENLLDILIRANFDVLWLDNNTGCKGVCDRIASARPSITENPDFCMADGCNDEALVEMLKTSLSHVKKDTVIVLHQIGSHGPAYYKRYPDAFRQFTPTCETSQIQLCSREEISNSYDNTILYTDHVLAKTIMELQNASSHVNAAMLYVSDHGESLGEMGIYLHGMPYAFSPNEQRHVPMVFWATSGFGDRGEMNISCIRDGAAQPLSHDNIFHSVLGMLQVTTDVYDPSLDLFDLCSQGRGHPPVTASLPSDTVRE